jgi:hypothetical protein
MNSITRSQKLSHGLVTALSTGIFFALAQTALANPLTDTHIFRVGVFEQDLDVKGHAVRDTQLDMDLNIDLDLDKVLGLDESSTTGFFMYQWRFAEKWSLQAFYSQLKNDGKAKASRDFTFDGKEYTAGLTLETEFNLDTLLVVANYSFIKNDRMELGAGFGLHAFDIETVISLDARLEGENNNPGGRKRSTSELLAPLPNLRGYGTYMITPKWSIQGALGWLSFKYDDYDGDYLYVNVATEYRFTERFGVGAAYQISDIDVSHDSSHGEQSFEIDLYGPSLYLTYGF